MHPLFCSCPCCIWSGASHPPPVCGRHSLSPPVDAGPKGSFTNQDQRVGERLLRMVPLLFPLPRSSWVLPVKLLKWSVSSGLPLKISFLVAVKKRTLKFNIYCILWERKEDLHLWQTWVILEKTLGKKNYRPVVSSHKSDKGSDIINTCAHPPLVMLFFILISDFKRHIS